MTAYLDQLLAQDRIAPGEHQALLRTGANSSEELYALTLHFPALFASVLPGGNLAKISAVAAQTTSQAFRGLALAHAGAPLLFSKGAQQPPHVPFPVGAQVGFAAAAAPGSASAANAVPLNAIDHHSALRAAGWPVRDQGRRGTCVAHAMVACKEMLDAMASGQAALDQSEQYLYWGAKQFDPSPADGTLHAHALTAMQQHGLCDESLWPYVQQSAIGPVHQGPPPAAAASAGQSACHLGGATASPSNGQALYRQLAQGPVAIGVPVFADPANPSRDNWNVGALVGYGRVAEPPPLSVVTGGHAVCCVGFSPDSNEPAAKGWFIIRNSWGNSFGSVLPHGGYHGPEPGYGQISWAYVDSYLWEMCWLR